VQPPCRCAAAAAAEGEQALQGGVPPNDLWQIDATQVALAAREPAWMLDVVDDHGRYLLAAVVWASRSWLSRARVRVRARVLRC
jgi:hypothetical protein